MKKLDKMYIKAATKLAQFKNSERGDTNFVSMLLIIGVVVVLAGLFLSLGRDAIEAVRIKVINFINSPS